MTSMSKFVNREIPGVAVRSLVDQMLYCQKSRRVAWQGRWPAVTPGTT